MSRNEVVQLVKVFTRLGIRKVRLTSRGELNACLFGNQPVDLLEPLRNHASHEAVAHLVRQALTEKLDCHPMRRGQDPEFAGGMWQVGG